MIHSITIKNFFSIGDEINLNFDAKAGHINAPELYIDAPLDKKTTKIAFIGGPNASGKSNILKALSFVKDKLTTQLSPKDHPMFKYMMFLGAKTNENSLIDIKFSMDKKRIFEYKMTFNFTRYVDESLIVIEKVSKRSSANEVFTRHWNGKKYDITTNKDFIPSIHKMVKLDELLDTGNNRLNSFVAMMSNYDTADGILREVADFWNNLVTDVVAFGPSDSVTVSANRVLEKCNENADFKEKFESIVKHMDIGYESIFKYQPPRDDAMAAYGILHSYPDSQQFNIFIAMESSGTQRLITVIDKIVSALSVPEGGVAVLDDLDAFIHPDLYEKIVDYFASPALNKNNAQLILCSHNYTTLNMLDKQQIFLVERDDRGMTDAWRLDEVEGIQARENFYARYMAGAYGAVPRSDR